MSCTGYWSTTGYCIVCNKPKSWKELKRNYERFKINICCQCILEKPIMVIAEFLS